MKQASNHRRVRLASVYPKSCEHRVNKLQRMGAESTNLRARELDAVSRKWGLVGFTLTLPTFSPERPYQTALDWSIRVSKCVIPPAASEIHMIGPAGSKSMELMRTSPEEKTSLQIPEPIERLRIVQS